MKKETIRFGDLVINEWASNQNPNKVLMYVSGGKMITCLSRNGNKVKFYNDKDLRLEKIGSVDFSEWQFFSEEIADKY